MVDHCGQHSGVRHVSAIRAMPGSLQKVSLEVAVRCHHTIVRFQRESVGCECW